MALGQALCHDQLHPGGLEASMADWTDRHARDVLGRMFQSAIAAADPFVVLAAHLPKPGKGRTIVVGAGKSAARMAAALEAVWDGPLEGSVVTRDGHEAPTRHIEVLSASHPVPDRRSGLAADAMLAKVAGLTEDDLVLCLMSGGGSALLAGPASGLTLADKQSVNQALLASGASIHEMNAVRKHLSKVKGGRLAAAAFPARVVTLAISDVPGDDPAVIASGPTVPDPSTFEDARAILERRKVVVPEAVSRHLATEPDETPKPGDPRLARSELRMIATPQGSLEAAAALARREGLTALILGDALEGEARDVGTVLAGLAFGCHRHGTPARPPCVLLSGGETTVTVGPERAGRGGRNTETLLGCAIALSGASRIWALMGDTDGIDGTEDAAGAIAAPDTLARASAAALDPHRHLAMHDSYSLFQQLGDLVITGPTLTNVNDFRAILIA